MLRRPLLQFAILSVLCGFCIPAFTQQPTWTIDLLKKDSTRPAKFKERKLGSEKMAEKKFTKFRHFTQNTFTHYNYYYNANNKINLVIEAAKSAQKDDYTKLLSFYPYSLENTATQKTELDSVILKSTAGILLHDLRNDWIDNMYLLMGKAYFFRNDLDTALATFQFINYNLFPRKKDEDYNRVVGTRDEETKGALSIANKEKQNTVQKIMSEPPSRNDALIWLVRTLIEQGEYPEAAGLINTLLADPNLPKRLNDDLEEVNAYWFYKQNIYDSSAKHLENALSNADTKQDLARSEYLLAQMLEMTKQFSKAAEYYDKVTTHTNSPLMDIHARLSAATMMKSLDPKEMDNSISNLLSMAKKDRYDSYRDILYFSAGQIALQKPDTNAATEYLSKSLKYNESNISLKNKAFIQLGEIAYNRKQYKISFSNYDSLQTGDTSIKEEQLEKIVTRRAALAKIVSKIDIIAREDSLQKIAAMSPAERDNFIKKLVKKLRKEKGLKEDDINMDGGVIGIDFKKDQTADLFGTEKGEWYFYNASLKSKGFKEFKSKWGARSNVDNWRLKSVAKTAINNSPTSTIPEMTGAFNPDEIAPVDQTPKPAEAPVAPQELDISYDGLMANVPTTDEKMMASNKLIAESIFELAKLYTDLLEDYEQAIVTYDESLRRFPDSLYNGEIYFGLYYCYNKLGNTAKAAYYKNLLTSKFGDSRASQLVNNPAATKSTEKNEAVTKQYENIYNLFIEGKFDEALNQKKIADSVNGNNYWTPQLLYIEAVYQIKQKNDSAAKLVLDTIVKLYPSTPIAAKAERMKDVLSRRAEIEAYLTNLQVTRAHEDQMLKMDETTVQPQTQITQPVAPTTDTVVVKAPPPKPVVADTIKKPAPVLVRTGEYSFDLTRKYNVMMILDKVDGTYIGEAKNAFARFNGEKSYTGITIARDQLNAEKALLIFASFANAEEALKYYDRIKKAAPDEVSWLPANKYSFLIIDDGNLQLLREKKNLDAYKALLNTQYPGRF